MEDDEELDRTEQLDPQELGGSWMDILYPLTSEQWAPKMDTRNPGPRWCWQWDDLASSKMTMLDHAGSTDRSGGTVGRPGHSPPVGKTL